MKAILLTLLLTFSCTRSAEVTREGMEIQISPITMKISHLDEIEWAVGMKKEEDITQSITFIVNMPKVSESDLDYLTERMGIDAWIVRLIVARGSESQDLGSLYSLFRPKKIARGSYDSGAASSVSLKVFYAAAYASEKFRRFKCPAFDHSKKITSMSIKGNNDDFSLTVGKTLSYPEKSHLVELTPSSFNGGHSLLGEYFIEIAPYNSKKKTIHANFKRIPMSVVVENETLIRVKSCDGINPEIQ